jgi:outer membrane protein assembly factor BamA
VAYHVLATPAYLLHGVTRPLGWGVRYVEQRFPDLFKPRRPPRGALPLVELGGPTGFLAGLAVYDNQLFGSAHSARVKGLYGGPDTFEAEASYQLPSPLGRGSTLGLHVNGFSDPRRPFFVNGNANDLRTDEARFSRDQIDVTARLNVAPPSSSFRGQVDLLYEYVDVRAVRGPKGDLLPQISPSGLGSATLLTSQLTLAADFTEGGRRTARGTEAILRLDYTHDLTGNRYQYGRYVAELRQYLPVGIFPPSRRLALRGRLEHVAPLFNGAAIPFYQLPGLGGQSTLRGFRPNRFRNDGALVLNAEYRYPIWSNLDALVFVDAGQVYDRLAEVNIDRFHWSYGGGLHLLHRRGLSARFEVAGSTAGVRTILTVEPTFRRLAR